MTGAERRIDMESLDVIVTDSCFEMQQCYTQRYLSKEQEDAYHFAGSLVNYNVLFLLSDTYYSSGRKYLYIFYYFIIKLSTYLS